MSSFLNEASKLEEEKEENRLILINQIFKKDEDIVRRGTGSLT